MGVAEAARLLSGARRVILESVSVLLEAVRVFLTPEKQNKGHLL